jgi:Ubiquitin-2 like Rad60 SUMO-like
LPFLAWLTKALYWVASSSAFLHSKAYTELSGDIFCFHASLFPNEYEPYDLGSCLARGFTTIKMEGEAPPQPANQISVMVRDMHNNEILFKVKSSSPLEKMMRVYCTRQGKVFERTRFLFDGVPVNSDSTPDSLEMADGEMIEVHEEQIGGC